LRFGFADLGVECAFPDKGLAGAFFGSGQITAAFCAVYWPSRGLD
jgi:hypothetical protein